MSVPNPLPKTIPIGTLIEIGGSQYELTSIGKRQYINNIIFYIGDIKNSITCTKFNNYTVPAQYIIWDSIQNIDENNSKILEILKKNCIWCGDELGPNQDTPYCDYGKIYCKEYYFALKERMAIDFREPNEALEYDKESVKRYVNNLLGIK